jgi:DNA processing protein
MLRSRRKNFHEAFQVPRRRLSFRGFLRSCPLVPKMDRCLAGASRRGARRSPGRPERPPYAGLKETGRRRVEALDDMRLPLDGAPPLRPDFARLRAFMALATIRGVGFKSLYDVADAGRCFVEAFDQGPSRQLGWRAPPGTALEWSAWPAMLGGVLDMADRRIAQFDRLGITVLFRGSPGFPPALLAVERPPHWLFVQGSVRVLAAPALTIVGTRNPSPGWMGLTRYIGGSLRSWGAPTVSGLAPGIDQAVHEQSLRAGVPTIAVLGTGILEEYPNGSAVLRDQIVSEGGSIVSEYPPHTPYSPANFVHRHRLQAALGRLLIPIAWRSGGGMAQCVRSASSLGRPIAGLRLADWPSDRSAFEPDIQLSCEEIFNLPQEGSRLDRFVHSAINQEAQSPTGQQSLFDVQ